MFQQDGGEFATAFLLQRMQRFDQGFRLGVQRKIEQTRIAFVETQVVNQAAAVARAHRLDLMLAVGKKCRVLELVTMLFAAEIDFDFLTSVADEKPPALVCRWQRDDECAEHGIELLGVAVGLEMAAFSI